ncbi:MULTISPECIES: JDVT-CTERM system glutamic-type intramembrane protease [unclassified Marinobacter]|uniref:JDVT-CTERM system glutamic-type intramembrane protease MrtJ n=1 Tax=unclassified Marinobacter TaxID=83889 RepID=UPI0026E35C03|nr:MULTISPECIES: JDVT-CTERM system glutamic-type intramembrane protease [unclassified Marinobacter]MDO6441659.1 JDVT-CTERM system glutamic-type intramembrane protease [Marinobacter sp. 2_MG-2023]MDO6822176.1 JDVT-CTERM system glutamic-type intramembrane protease [Marinobacter sp. 1_MG-2023]
MALIAGCSLSVAIGALAGRGAELDTSWMALVSLVLWAPVVEEFAFRGVVQGYLGDTAFGKRCLAGLSFANLIAALLFTVWHLVYRTDLLAWLVFFPALAFGYFRDRHGSLVPCVILHGAWNAALLPGWYLFS